MPDMIHRHAYQPGDTAIVRNDGDLTFAVGGQARRLAVGDRVTILRREPDHDCPVYGLGYWFTHAGFVEPGTGELMEFVLNDGMIEPASGEGRGDA